MKSDLRLNRRAISLGIFMLLCLYSVACSRTGSLQIEAQIIYNMGGPQPIARQTFYLLDSSWDQIVKSEFKAEDTSDKARLMAGASLMALLAVANSKVDLQKEPTIKAFLESKPFWEPHIIQTTQTDFKGQATFENLKPGDYWVTGITETRSSVAIWNYKVSVKLGENKAMLDQNNALYSK
jgi:hypothetical protein